MVGGWRGSPARVVHVWQDLGVFEEEKWGGEVWLWSWGTKKKPSSWGWRGGSKNWTTPPKATVKKKI